jgi:signal peptidase I
MKAFLREFGIEIIVVVLFVVFWFTCIETFEIFETSMLPNFHEGERVIVFKAAYWGWTGHPHRGDVVVVKAPQSSEGDYIKRVIGLPGDTLEIVQGKLYVNGTRMNEPYVKNSFTYTMDKVVVPSHSYFVLGDNRDISNDSHRFGALPSANIVGKVVVIYWPPQNWKFVPSYKQDKQLPAVTKVTEVLPWPIMW